MGHPDRGDDGVGPAVVARLAAGGPLPRVRTLVRADPTELPELWDGVGLAVLVDAVSIDPVSIDPVSIDPVPVDPVPVRPVAVDPVPVGRMPVGHGRRPGTLLLLRTGPGEPPLPAGTGTGARGSHGFGVAAAVELARALGRLPPRVVVLGIVVTGTRPGAPLSPPVAAAVGVAADRVRRLLR